MKKQKPLSGECVYCGKPATSRDHVPPRNLFPGPQPSALVTVPSCDACNQGASLDDEYFRLIVALRHDLDHPDAKIARETAVRSLSRPEASGLRASFLLGTEFVDLVTPGGLYAGRSGLYEFDVGRLLRVVRRITLGLFYRETCRRLPDSYKASVWLPSVMDTSASPLDGLRSMRSIATTLSASGPPKFIGNRVLSYWWLPVANGDPNCTSWLMVFYGRVMFLAATMPVGGLDVSQIRQVENRHTRAPGDLTC